MILLGIAGTARAVTADDWMNGKEAFRQGDFESALVYFGLVRDAGMSGPAVHYNIAVSHYQLGQYAAAGEAFELIRDRFPAMRALAEYNLGLVARRLGDDTAAAAHFLRAYELSETNREIRVLASRALGEIPLEPRARAPWTAAVGLRAGHDDNVVLRDQDTVSPGATTDSPMLDLWATVEGPWHDGGGLRMHASAYLVRYPDAEDFDQSEIAAGVLYDWSVGIWRIEAGADANAGTLGGESFDREYGGHFRVVRELGRTASLDFRYAHHEIRDADSLYPGIEGSRQQLDLRYRWSRDGHRLQLRYWTESNEREDPGASPDRHRYAIDYRYDPGRGPGWEAGIDFRRSEYRDVATPRDEDLTTLRGALSWRLAGDWLTLLEYRQAHNDSTDEFFSYDRRQITIGAMKLF